MRPARWAPFSRTFPLSHTDEVEIKSSESHQLMSSLPKEVIAFSSFQLNHSPATLKVPQLQQGPSTPSMCPHFPLNQLQGTHSYLMKQII